MNNVALITGASRRKWQKPSPGYSPIPRPTSPAARLIWLVGSKKRY
jgi:hypothetical protein